MKHYLYIILAIFLVFLYSCANMGSGPQGGPKDMTPPKLVKSEPAQNQTNVKSKKIVLEFDEIVLLDKVAEQLVISPPQKNMPEIQAINKKITIVLKDTLQPNTTYNITLGDAITDNKEKTALKNFSLAFSTGNEIDTLSITGYVLWANNLSKAKGVTVGIYENGDDSLFTTQVPLRIAKTNADGYFRIDNVHEGEYKIRALDDQNRDYKFSLKNEAIAFLDHTVRPYAASKIEVEADTMQVDTTQILLDKLLKKKSFELDEHDVILSLFNEEASMQYFVKSERLEPNNFSLYFAKKAESLPLLEPINFDQKDFYFLEKNATLDSLKFWITDTTLVKQDTLKFKMTYQKSDSLYNLVPQTDTISVVYKKRVTKKKRANDQPMIAKTNFISMKMNLDNNRLEIYDDLMLNFSEPIVGLTKEAFTLTMQDSQVDSIWNEVNFQLEADTINSSVYYIAYDWEENASLKLSIDSAAIHSIYGNPCKKTEVDFSIKRFEEYANFYLKVPDAPRNSFVELLDSNDKPLYKEFIQNGQVSFELVKPGTYFARIIIDEDWNGEWTTGKYDEQKQPEKVFYFEKPIMLRKNWDLEETWEYQKLNVLNQKPMEIKSPTSK